ncbi:MFS transporter [Penicillium mononematosum]|uniref:MFS transporter n=1 Tax=Penicillium mononematosum TaxID=268346 RepID=UPI00254772A5|nr:MFS transporter [Penicillium mononematosum]KAJ6179920.1 MFS transporter [Penicillium mononematosum]
MIWSNIDGPQTWVMVVAVFWNNAHWGKSSPWVNPIVENRVTWKKANRSLELWRVSSLSYFAFDICGGKNTGLRFHWGSFSVTCARHIPSSHNPPSPFWHQDDTRPRSLLETAELLGASWSTEIWQLYLSQGVCFGWGLGMQYLSTTYLIPQCFEKHRSLAAGICTAGTGTCGIIYSLATHAMLARFGIPWSYRILAIVQLVVNAICVLVIRDRRPQGVRAYQMPKINFRLYLRYEMWLFIGWSFFSVMGLMVIWFSPATYGRSVGLTSTQGSIVTAVMNIGQMFGRPTVGLLSDRIGRTNMAAFATCISGLLCLLL